MSKLNRYIEAKEEYDEMKIQMWTDVRPAIELWLEAFGQRNYTILDWEIEGDFIYLTTNEGCMGYYEDESYDIPITALKDPQKAVDVEKARIEDLKKANEKKRFATMKDERQLQYEELKKEFGDV